MIGMPFLNRRLFREHTQKNKGVFFIYLGWAGNSQACHVSVLPVASYSKLNGAA
jgi:hypothetical protein